MIKKTNSIIYNINVLVYVSLCSIPSNKRIENEPPTRSSIIIRMASKIRYNIDDNHDYCCKLIKKDITFLHLSSFFFYNHFNLYCICITCHNIINTNLFKHTRLVLTVVKYITYLHSPVL